MVKRARDALAQARIIRADLHREGALSRRGQEVVRREDLDLGDRQAKPLQSGHREDDCVVLAVANLPHARVYIPADLAWPRVGTERPQERRSPRARGPHHRVRWEVGETAAPARDEDVARILADGDRRDDHIFGARGREILERMHGQVDLPGPRAARRRRR